MPTNTADTIDLNADLGESFGPWPMGNDPGLLPFVTSVNIACGFHAGDPITMDRTVEAALERGIRIGAHPSHLDLRGFGRREIDATPEEVETDVLYQAGALRAFVESRGGRLWRERAYRAPSRIMYPAPRTVLSSGASKSRSILARRRDTWTSITLVCGSK